MSKINLVHGDGIIVLKDYIHSLNIIHKQIHINDFDLEKFKNSKDIYIFTQMWLNLNAFPEEMYKSRRFIFLNVEMITEDNRWNHVYDMLQKNVRIADYSKSNIMLMKNNLIELKKQFNIDVNYTHEFIYLPYQFNIKENYLLKNIENKYKYDIGIINATPKKDASVNANLKYRRTEIWEKINLLGLNCINITCFDEERDNILNQCKVILNIHHFGCYNIFEHIRCDRLIFADKLIISDKSLHMKELDVYDFVIWEEYDNIINKTIDVLYNFEMYQEKMKKHTKDEIIHNRIKTLEYNYRLLHDI
jgi:hypothetical protein